MATVAGAGDAATQPRVEQSFLLVMRDFIIQLYDFFMRDCFRFCVVLRFFREWVFFLLEFL